MGFNFDGYSVGSHRETEIYSLNVGDTSSSVCLTKIFRDEGSIWIEPVEGYGDVGDACSLKGDCSGDLFAVSVG